METAEASSELETHWVVAGGEGGTWWVKIYSQKESRPMLPAAVVLCLLLAKCACPLVHTTANVSALTDPSSPGSLRWAVLGFVCSV